MLLFFPSVVILATLAQYPWAAHAYHYITWPDVPLFQYCKCKRCGVLCCSSGFFVYGSLCFLRQTWQQKKNFVQQWMLYEIYQKMVS